MTNAVKPVLQSLLVADRVYTDAATGKKIIAGIFQQLFFFKNTSFQEIQHHEGVRAAGFQSGSPFVYASLTDVVGEHKFTLRYIDLDDEKPRFEGQVAVTSTDRLKTIEVVAPLPPLPTDKPGVFALELLWRDEPLGSYRIIVTELPKSGDDENVDA